MQAMKIRAIAPWFGGKRTMAPLIARQLGRHTQYFEPFCGSMAVLFAKEPSRGETVNDLHRDLINLARILQNQDEAERLYERLQRTLFDERLLTETAPTILEHDAHNDLRDPDGDRAYWYFLASWMGRNGVAGTARADYRIAVRWTASGGSPTIRFRSCTESIPAWHQRLQNVVILNRDAFQIIPKFDDAPGSAIYADPPYHTASRCEGATNDHGGSGRYLHEFDHGDTLFGDEHLKLRDQLAAFKRARVVVSYYDCPRVRELYDGWTFIDCTRQKNIQAQNGRGERKKDAPELLIVNGKEF